jgi:hypothetical protein
MEEIKNKDIITYLSFSNHNNVILDEYYEKIIMDENFTLPLYDYQKATISAMVSLENSREVRRNINDRIYVNKFNAAKLCLPVGSGKTRILAGVIMMNKKLSPKSNITSIFQKNELYAVATYKFKKMFYPTIVFVSNTVVNQWIAELKPLNLNILTVKNAHDMKLMMDIISKGTINIYNIILVKCGIISTGSIKFPFGIEMKHAKISTYDIISSLKVLWNRVIIDDYETIKISYNLEVIDALMTWFVSSTNKYIKKVSNPWVSHTDETVLKSRSFNRTELFSNDKNYIHVLMNEQYIKESVNMPRINFHAIRVKHKERMLLSLVSDLNVAGNILEMINGDAIKEAATALNIVANSVCDIFSSILAGKFKEYEHASLILKFIDSERERIEGDDNNEFIPSSYTEKELIIFKPFQHNNKGEIRALFDAWELKYKNIKEVNSHAIKRVRDNITHDQCPICFNNLKETENIFIVKCCNAVFCGQCAFKAQNFNRQNNKGKCSMCRTQLDLKDLIYIGTNNIDNIFNDITDDVKEQKEDKKNDSTTEAKDYIFTKYDRIIDILHGRYLNMKNDETHCNIDLQFPNIINGTAQAVENSYRKILVFTDLNESSVNITNKLDEHKEKYWTIKGNADKISATIKEFTEYKQDCCLVIHGFLQCSGVNLQCVTDIVFYHYLNSTTVEEQVIGRGNRIGREYILNIWYLLYENEEYLFNNRKISQLRV